jgi:catechol 2,3-dioxygenase-like lactoylglutathione lyase family enzyme
VEFVYAPGDRPRVRALFEALGFRVLDPQTDPTPADLGPAAGPYLIVFLDSDDTDLIDNVFYASEAGAEQWALESALRERVAADADLATRAARFREAYARQPQAMTHVGVGYPDAEGVREALRRLSDDPQLAGRLTLSGPYEPGEPGSVDDRVVQAFVYTDLVAVGLLLGGQQIELQVRLDGG